MIRNIVFDMGNVILKFDPEYFMTREGVTDPADRDIVRRELFHSAEWALMDLGHLTEAETEVRVMPRIPERLREKTKRLLYHWADDREMVPGMVELVTELKRAGYGIYLLSNAGVSQHTYWARCEVSKLFDGKLISYDVKTVKPDARIYEMFTQKFGLKPEECVFVDDSAPNVAGALARGWQGIVFHGDRKETEEKLRELGVRF